MYEWLALGRINHASGTHKHPVLLPASVDDHLHLVSGGYNNAYVWVNSALYMLGTRFIGNGVRRSNTVLITSSHSTGHTNPVAEQPDTVMQHSTMSNAGCFAVDIHGQAWWCADPGMHLWSAWWWDTHLYMVSRETSHALPTTCTGSGAGFQKLSCFPSGMTISQIAAGTCVSNNTYNNNTCMSLPVFSQQALTKH